MEEMKQILLLGEHLFFSNYLNYMLEWQFKGDNSTSLVTREKTKK